MQTENFIYGYSLTHQSSSDGIFAVAESTNNGYRLHYVHTDNLGSWDIITDEQGYLEQSLSFDAWGNRRNANTWNGPATDTPLFDRGFTGHEHLYDFGLINMNGRVYDPYMSSFLSPDNFIQCPDNSQNFNRYAYCMNNPLRYTDPSGEVFGIDDIIIAAAIGAAINVAYQGLSGNITTPGDFFVAMGIGALSGIVGLAVGSAAYAAMPYAGFYGGAVAGAAAGASSSFVTAYGNSRYQGNSIGDSFKTAGLSSLTGMVTGGIMGGIAGGLNSLEYGGNFWNGKITVDYAAEGTPMFNHPNLRNFSNYDSIEPQETDALVRRIEWTYGSDVIDDFGITEVTTKAPDGFSIDPSTGIYTSEDSDLFGRLIYNPKTNTSRMYISPYASTHHDAIMFKAITGHELTHAYHFSLVTSGRLSGVDAVNSENAALDYSYMIYSQAGYTDMCSTITKTFQYPRMYYVPANYNFSTIEFAKSIMLPKL